MDSKLIKIDDEEIKLFAKRIDYNLYLYEDKLLKMFRTHQTEHYSYYTEIK